MYAIPCIASSLALVLVTHADGSHG